MHITIVPIPAQVDEIETNAEDVMDDITNKDWTKVQNRLNIIKSKMSELSPILKSASVNTTLIDNINKAISNFDNIIASHDVYNLKKAANQITQYVPDISDNFKTTLPTDLGRIDYLGREIILNVEKGDWESAKNNHSKISMAWNNIKGKLSSTYSKDANEFNTSVDNLLKDINSQDINLTKKEATALLDKTDLLEKDFAKQQG